MELERRRAYACSLPATSSITNAGLVSLPTWPEQHPLLSSQQPHAVVSFPAFFLFYLQGLPCWFYLVWVGPDLLDVCNNVFILLLKVDVMMLFFCVCAHDNYFIALRKKKMNLLHTAKQVTRLHAPFLWYKNNHSLDSNSLLAYNEINPLVPTMHHKWMEWC